VAVTIASTHCAHPRRDSCRCWVDLDGWLNTKTARTRLELTKSPIPVLTVPGVQ